MATGLEIPVGVNAAGGARLTSGSDNDRKAIFLALGSGWSEHAFQQDIALGQDMVFQLNDQSVRAYIKRKLIAIFREFQVQNRFKLLTETLKWTAEDDTQTLELKFKYANLEEDEVKDYIVKFTAAGPQLA